MPLCTHCGKEIGEDVSFCPNCGERFRVGDKGEMRRRKRSKVAWFFIGLVVVSAIGGGLYVAEQASLPYELRVELELLEHIREAPYSIQVAIAREKGVTVEELLTSPYDRWAPKVLVGLLCAYGGAGVVYLAYSFFRRVDRDGASETPSKQLLL